MITLAIIWGIALFLCLLNIGFGIYARNWIAVIGWIVAAIASLMLVLIYSFGGCHF